MDAMHRVLFAAILALGACSENSGEPVGPETARAEPAQVETPQPATADAPDEARLQTTAEQGGGAPVPGRTVRCRITSDHGDDFSGPCIFNQGSGGSFRLSLPDEAPIVDGVVMVSVYVEEEGVADVRGLTLDGINSRWGRATRLQADPACWKGGDFEVCAWG